MLTRQKDVRLMIREYLLHLPFKEKGRFLLWADVCAVLWGLWGERKNRVFRGVERDPREVWSLVRFHVSLWSSVSKTFCKYAVSNIILS